MSPIHVSIETEDGRLIQDLDVYAGHTIPIISGDILKNPTQIQELQRRCMYVEGTNNGGYIRGEIARKTDDPANFTELLITSRDILILHDAIAPVIGFHADKLSVLDRFNIHKGANNTQQQEAIEAIVPCVVTLKARKL